MAKNIASLTTSSNLTIDDVNKNKHIVDLYAINSKNFNNPQIISLDDFLTVFYSHIRFGINNTYISRDFPYLTLDSKYWQISSDSSFNLLNTVFKCYT